LCEFVFEFLFVEITHIFVHPGRCKMPEPCRHFLTGYCRFAASCKFHHPGHDFDSGVAKSHAPDHVTASLAVSRAAGPGGASSSLTGCTSTDNAHDRVLDHGSPASKAWKKDHRIWTHIFLLAKEWGTFKLIPWMIGTDGKKMKTMAKTTECKIRVRGKGSGHLEVDGNKEAPVHLMVAITTSEDHVDVIRFRVAVEQMLEMLEQAEKLYHKYGQKGPLFGFGEASSAAFEILGDLIQKYPLPAHCELRRKICTGGKSLQWVSVHEPWLANPFPVSEVLVGPQVPEPQFHGVIYGLQDVSSAVQGLTHDPSYTQGCGHAAARDWMPWSQWQMPSATWQMPSMAWQMPSTVWQMPTNTWQMPNTAWHMDDHGGGHWAGPEHVAANSFLDGIESRKSSLDCPKNKSGLPLDGFEVAMQSATAAFLAGVESDNDEDDGQDVQGS
jgi:hypothetical protein